MGAEQRFFSSIHTERLLIRQLEFSDAEAFWCYKKMPDAVRFQTWRPTSLYEVEQFIQKMRDVAPCTPDAWLQVAVCLKDSGTMIGDIGLHFLADPAQMEIGYTISPNHQRKGYGTEAVRAILGYLFDTLEKHRVTASLDPRNAPSAAVLEKLGFRKEAQFRKSYFMDGEWCDDWVYAMLREEWQDSHTVLTARSREE